MGLRNLHGGSPPHLVGIKGGRRQYAVYVFASEPRGPLHSVVYSLIIFENLLDAQLPVGVGVTAYSSEFHFPAC